MAAADRRMLLIHPIQELPRALPALLAAFVAGNGSGQGLLWSAAALVITLGFAFSRWFTTRYRITEDHVQVGSGLLRRRVRAVSRDRVRTVDVTARAMHRLLGLTRVDIGTGRSDRAGDGGVRLDGLTEAEAARLREELLHRREPAPAPPRRTTDRRGAGPGARDRAGAPGSRAGSATRPSRSPASSRSAWSPASSPTSPPRRTSIPSATARCAIGRPPRPRAARADRRRGRGPRRSWPWWWPRRSATRSRSGASGSPATPAAPLHVTRGLITTRATTIEERRLHGVEISEPLLLRMVAGARLIAIATGLRVGRGAERGGSLLLPPGSAGRGAPRGRRGDRRAGRR